MEITDDVPIFIAMSQFAFLLHHSINEYPQGKIEIFFKSLKSKIAMYERHVELTSDLYKKEQNDAVTSLNQSFAEPVRKAKKKYDELIKEYGDDMEGHQLADHESGLGYLGDEQSRNDYDITEEFTEMSGHFNNLALMQAHSFFEKEITDLCRILKLEFDQVIKIEDFGSKDYIKGPLKYLELVIRLNISSLEPFTNKLRDIQYLRNRIVHDRGEFQKESNNHEDKLDTINGIVTKSKKRLVLDEEEDIYVIKILDIAFILDHYEVIRQFFQELFNLIEQKLKYKLLKSRLEYVFSSLTKKPRIEIEKVEFKTSNFKIHFSVKFPKSSGIGRQLRGELYIKKLKKTPVYIKCTGIKTVKVEDFVQNLKSIEYVLLEMADGYFLISKKVQAELFLYA